MKRRKAKALARERRTKGAELLAKVTRQPMPERSLSELRRLRGEVQERVEEATTELGRHNVFAGKSSPHGRRLMWKLDFFSRRGKGKRQRTEVALVAADEVLSMNRVQRRKHLGERSVER